MLKLQGKNLSLDRKGCYRASIIYQRLHDMLAAQSSLTSLSQPHSPVGTSEKQKSFSW